MLSIKVLSFQFGKFTSIDKKVIANVSAKSFENTIGINVSSLLEWTWQCVRADSSEMLDNLR